MQRTLIAAEQGASIINLAFVMDIPYLKWKWFEAGAGTSGWAGAIDMTMQGRLKARHPLFYSIQQLMDYMDGYTKIERVKHADPQVRLYAIHRGKQVDYVAWLDPRGVCCRERPGLSVRFGCRVR